MIAFKRKAIRTLIGFNACVALALVAVWPSAAHSQVTWDANTGTSGPQDGSGTWSTADANWWNGSTNVVWPNLTTSSAIIGANSGAAGTITASGSLTLNAITFNAPGSGTYTLTGGTLGFAGSSPTITANAAASIGSAITSGVGLTKSGTGTLTLSGIVSNTSGNMSISRGAVTLTGTLTNTASSGFNVGSSNGGLLTIAGGSMSTSWSNARAIVIAPGSGQSGTMAMTSGALSASGLLISEDSGGNGVFTQSGGSTTIGSGNFWLSGNTSTLTVSGGSFTSGNMNYFALGSTNPSTSTINVSGSGAITLGTLQYGLSGRNGFTTTVNVGDGTGGGTLQVNNMIWSGATTVASTINFNSGTFVAGGSYSIPTQIATVVRSGGANIDVASTRTLTISNTLADGGGGGGLTKLGAGTLSLTGANTFTGTTRLAAGSLSIGNALALQSSTLDLNAADSGTVSAISQNSTLGGLAGSRNLDMLTRTLSVGNNGASTTYSGGLSNGSLTKVGNGTLTLSGTSIYSGGTTISSGTILLGSGSALGASTGALAVNGGGLDLGGNSVTVGALSGSSGAMITSVASATLTASSASSSTYAGSIGGAIALTKSGAGALTLSGSNSYGRTTTLSAGQLNINAAYAIGTGTFTFNGGNIDNTSLAPLTLATNNPQAWNSDFTFVGSSPLDLGTGAVTLGANRNVTVTSSTLTVGGGISAGFGLTKSGAGALTLSGSNSFGGNTTLSAGQLNINNPNAIGTGTFTIGGGSIDNTSGSAVTLATNNPQAWNADFTFVGSSALDLGTGTVTLGANRNVTVTSSTLAVGGGIGGAFSLTKSGGGTLRLSGASSYSGGTVISSGTVVLANASALGATAGSLAVNGGGLDLGGNSVTVGTLSGSSGARITSAAAAALTGSSASSSTYAGSITGAVALAKAGAGTLTLSGSSSYSGGTTLTGGGLTIANANALGTSGLTFNVDADTSTYFNLPTSGTIANAIAINKPGVNRTYYFWQNQASDVGLSGNISVASGNGLQFRLNGPSSGTFTLTGSNAFGADVYTSTNVTFRIGGTNAAGGQVWRPDITTKMILLDGANFRSVIGNSVASFSMETSGTASVSGVYFTRSTVTTTVNTPAGAQLTFSSIATENLASPGVFTKTGDGTMIIGSGPAATYTVNGGVLQVASLASALSGSTAPNFLVLSGGTLRYAGSGESTAKQFTLGASGGGLEASGAGTVAFTSTAAVSFAGSGARTLTLTGTNAGDNTLAAAIGNNGSDVVSLAKTGAGTWVLSGSNTYTGATTVGAGRLRAGGNSSLSANSAFTVASGAVLGLNGSAASIGSLAGAGTLENGHASTAAALTVGGDNTSTTFSGVIQNGAAAALGLTKAGSGRLTLTSANSYTGATSISAGVLEIGPTGAINSTSGISVNGSTAEFKYNSATALTQSLTLTQGTISGTGTIGAAVAFAAGDYLSPGNSPGTQAYTSQLTWSPLGTYQWELNSLTGVAGTNWDFVNVSSGTLNLSGLSASPGNQFVLDLITLDAFNAAGPLALPFDGGTYTLPIASYNPANFLLPTGFSNTAGTNLTSLFTINLGNWQGEQPQLGNVSVKINSTATGIDLVIVPEPGTLVFAGIGIAMAGWSLRNRRRSAP